MKEKLGAIYYSFSQQYKYFAVFLSFYLDINSVVNWCSNHETALIFLNGFFLGPRNRDPT